MKNASPTNPNIRASIQKKFFNTSFERKRQNPKETAKSTTDKIKFPRIMLTFFCEDDLLDVLTLLLLFARLTFPLFFAMLWYYIQLK